MLPARSPSLTSSIANSRTPPSKPSTPMESTPLTRTPLTSKQNSRVEESVVSGEEECADEPVYIPYIFNLL